MISKTMIAAGLIAITSFAAVPANASGLSVQFGFGGPGWSGQGGPGHGWNHHRGHRWQHHRLSRQQVRRILRHHGFHQIRFIDTRGPVYQLRARRHGHTFFLVVSAGNGQILSRYRV
jgi:hypothetical protein